MRRLLVAELSRLRSRRLTWIALVAVLLAIGGLQVAVYQSVKPLTQTEIAQGQAQFEQAKKDYEQNREEYEAGEKECLEQGNPADVCESEPKQENYTYRSPEKFEDITNVVVTVVVFVTTLAMLFVGASFIGAEYSSGALANWLSFIPERGKVFASKLLALVLASAVVGAIASALTIGVGALVTRFADAQVTGVQKIVEMGGRGVAIVVIGAVVGFGLAMLTRHTIAAAGTVLGYLLVSFVISVLSQAIAPLQSLKAWLPENNVLAFLNHGYKYYTYVTTVTEEGSMQQDVEHTISFAHSVGYWSVVLVVVVAVTFAVFRRRDVN